MKRSQTRNKARRQLTVTQRYDAKAPRRVENAFSYINQHREYIRPADQNTLPSDQVIAS